MKWLVDIVHKNLALRVLLGFSLGIFTGLFLGESAEVFSVIGVAYIRLFQMPIIPYIIFSLISGLGSLNFSSAKALFIRGGMVLLGLWSIVFIALALVPLGFPEWVSASFFSTSLIQPPLQVNFLELFLPSNPFSAMANTVIPSVVTFSIALGLAFTTMEDKKTVMEVFAKLTDGLVIITRFVAQLAPFGVFAIAANAAGTLRLEDLNKLQVYIIIHGLISLILTFWVLPALVSACTSLKYIDIVNAVRAPLVTAFATANLLVVLPILVENSKKLMGKLVQDELTSASIDVLIPASFNFPNLGKLLSLAFIPFAAWYVGSSISILQYPTFLIAGAAVLFADGTLATNFLLNLFKIPVDMLQLYITVEVFTARFGTLLAAMHTVCLGILGTCALEGLIKIRPRKLIRIGIISILLILSALASVNFIFTYIFPNNYTQDELLGNLELLRVKPKQTAKVYTTSDSIPKLNQGEEQINPLAQIKLEQKIRVCYRQNIYPLSYFNQQGDLVGLDVELSYILAKELGVELEFVPLDNVSYSLEKLSQKFKNNYCHIGIPSFPTTPQNAELVKFTDPVINMSLGFLVQDHLKNKFNTWQELTKNPRLNLAIPERVSYYIAKIKGLLPEANITVIDTNVKDFLTPVEPRFDALILPAEIAAAWAILYPNYTVVVPQPIIKIPMSYPLPEDANKLTEVINIWLNLKKQDGTISSLYNYWIQGKVESVTKPRWSIIRDVLHWVD